ncbi:stage V sporulation protein AD [Serpentinicella sp. ANB-PHB4]|uniref:stage V sporulation protein AD n=1 Tax=Serpentinicella sp. ANB-PHB4 TaxID=3074076 RepID=UPI00285B224C|nr:stage V sporulation protein AD [Serpentinicella sp. ANB-PHB4]MDR5660061.1 stage V sporulation protein AD [Serpentinicella sp. ANB-PHB4]
MAVKKVGKQTVKFKNPPTVLSVASIVGPKEREGPLGNYFDKTVSDDIFNEKSWEKAESKFIKEAICLATKKALMNIQDIDYMLGGDLLNQLMSTNFAARDMQIPFYGLFSACSTLTESLGLGSKIIDGGYADYVVVSTASHFATAERQFRNPLELGNQRKLTAQWTVTGSGAAILSRKGHGPYITYVTTGKVIDLGINDVNNMGAAMAPAAVNTIVNHFKDTKSMPSDYDLIVTGDLGKIGREIAIELLEKENYKVEEDKFIDCGVEIFNHDCQDTHAGGSGAGCCAVVFCGYLFKQLVNKECNHILLVATGALLSTTSCQQGESIPSIAHAVSIKMVL